MTNMQDLVDKLNYYTEQYNKGNPLIPDTEWDRLYYQLVQMEHEAGYTLPNSPTQKVYYPVVNELTKVKHNHPMLSLDKTKEIDDVVEFLGGKPGIAMAKMDGLTCSIRYMNGELMSAETRGDGEYGEDISHNIKFVVGVPWHIDWPGEVIIDGEIIVTLDKFNSDEYKHPRNYAAGSIRLLNSKESAARNLTFVAWDCIKGLDMHPTLNEKLYLLNTMGFTSAPYIPLPTYFTDKAHIEHAIILIKAQAKEENYPIDGIVFKFDDCAYYNSLGATGHHFRGGLAYKFEDEIVQSTLLNIEWTIGKTGQLTPVTIFEPIEIDGTTIERANVHNIDIMTALLNKPYKGQAVYIYKANQIIPQIHHSDYEPTDTAIYFEIPTTCPICGGATKRINDNSVLICDNPNCEGKLLNQLDHFVGKKGLDIKGLSKATLQKLIDWGWVGNRIELFSLREFEEEWKKQPGFGPKSVSNILDAIDAARQETELWRFISGLAIPLIGSTYAKEMAKREPVWFNIREDIEGKYDFTQWAGFGYEMRESLFRFDYFEADELAHIINLTNSLWEDPDIEKPTTILDGIVFCITGSLHKFKNRDELKTALENKGAKVVTSVSKNTNYLINNDINSTSSKNVSAKKLNIPIITEDEVISRFLTE